MELKVIIVLLINVCVGQLKKGFDDKERQSKEEIKQWFIDKVSLDPCINYNCSKTSLCNLRNLISDVACLINVCQNKCRSKEKPCVIECLNLDSCNDSETGEEYMDCIRNSTVKGRKAVNSFTSDLCDDLPIKDRLQCRLNKTPKGNVTKRNPRPEPDPTNARQRSHVDDSEIETISDQKADQNNKFPIWFMFVATIIALCFACVVCGFLAYCLSLHHHRSHRCYHVPYIPPEPV